MMVLLTKLKNGYMMKTKITEAEMLKDILWLLTIVKQVSDYRLDKEKLKEIREKYE